MEYRDDLKNHLTEKWLVIENKINYLESSKKPYKAPHERSGNKHMPKPGQTIKSKKDKLNTRQNKKKDLRKEIEEDIDEESKIINTYLKQLGNRLKKVDLLSHDINGELVPFTVEDIDEVVLIDYPYNIQIETLKRIINSIDRGEEHVEGTEQTFQIRNKKEIEESVEDGYENVVFLQNHEAEEAIDIFRNEGIGDVVDYLAQYHYPGEHEVVPTIGAGRNDKIYEVDGYTLVVNPQLEYIGLYYKDDGKGVDQFDQGLTQDELNEKRGVPKGVDPDKHERCVKAVKKDSDVDNPYAVCNASLTETNNTRPLPKSLEPWGDIIEKVDDERRYGNGWWVYLKPGYISPDSETTTIHEKNLKTVIHYLKRVEKDTGQFNLDEPTMENKMNESQVRMEQAALALYDRVERGKPLSSSLHLVAETFDVDGDDLHDLYEYGVNEGTDYAHDEEMPHDSKDEGSRSIEGEGGVEPDEDPDGVMKESRKAPSNIRWLKENGYM